MNVSVLSNIQNEQSILAAALNDEGLMILKDLKVRPEEFYRTGHQILYKAILKTYEEMHSVDLVLLSEYCTRNKLLEGVGGTAYIAELSAGFISNANLNNYVDILRGYKLKRDLLNIAALIEENQELEPKELMNKVQNKIMNIQKENDNEEEQEQLWTKYIDNKEKAYIGEIEACNTIKTGLMKLDEHIQGFSAAELITIFAFSGVGKTAVSGQIALNMARSKHKVMYFSLEMTYNQMMDRLVSNVTRIDHKKVKYVKKAFISESEFEAIVNKSASINNYIKIYNTRYLNDIISKIQIEKMKDNVDVVFVDYIGLIEGVKAQDERMKITEVTRKLKALANDSNIPIVILAQATQEAAKKNENKNYAIYEKLSDTDIAESASVFRDSDTVLGIYRNTLLDDDKYRKSLKEDRLDYNSKDATVNPERINIMVKKCRNSTKKTLAFRWSGETFRIENMY